MSKESSRAGICIITPTKETKLLSFKHYFECTNNVAEYEDMILGLNALKNLKANRISIYGDSQLVINQVKGVYQTKHPRMRSYRNLVLELLENFTEFTFFFIPRDQNTIVDALDTSASVFKILIYPNKNYEIQVKHRPAIPDNIKY